MVSPRNFLLKRSDRETEAFLINKAGKHYAYLNLCRHWSVGLDFEDNDFFFRGWGMAYLQNHGAIYYPASGECASGPCGGASLYRVPLLEKEGALYAVLDQIDWGD